MKVIIVFTSIAYGNTEKVARAMSQAEGTDLAKTAETTPDVLSKYDVVGFGSGIYNGKHHQDIFDLVGRMPESSGKRAFVFSTSGYGTTKLNKKLVEALEKKGLRVIGDFACKGFDTAGINRLYGGAAKGRPNGADLEAARTFAKNLIS